MKQTGVDLFLDAHGDEDIPHSFIMSASDNCSLSKRESVFRENLEKVSNSFQTAVDYNTFKQGENSCCGSNCGNTDLSKANYYVADKFSCLSMVLEMPFINNEETDSNMPIEQNKELGRSMINPLLLAIEKIL